MGGFKSVLLDSYKRFMETYTLLNLYMYTVNDACKKRFVFNTSTTQFSSYPTFIIPLFENPKG